MMKSGPGTSKAILLLRLVASIWNVFSGCLLLVISVPIWIVAPTVRAGLAPEQFILFSLGIATLIAAELHVFLFASNRGVVIDIVLRAGSTFLILASLIGFSNTPIVLSLFVLFLYHGFQSFMYLIFGSIIRSWPFHGR